jgi:hypothetical protein
MKRIEEEYLQMEPAIDEMSEQFIDNLDRDSDNSSSNTKPTSDDEMS